MPTPSKRLELLLEQVEENCVPERRLAPCSDFMIACLEMIADQMSPVSAKCFQTAKDHRQGDASLSQLDEAYVACWQEVGDGVRSMRMDNPAISTGRAIICLLDLQRHPVMSEDFLDLTSLFLQFVNSVEPQWQRQEGLLKVHFRHCLENA